MPIILINKICVLFGARFCSNILLGVNNVKAYLMQVALNYKIQTKYYENIRQNKYKESPKTHFGEPSL
jgi:hypothetical protein